jgi:hypothetical protein
MKRYLQLTYQGADKIQNDIHFLDKKFHNIALALLISLVVCSSDRICVAAQ